MPFAFTETTSLNPRGDTQNSTMIPATTIALSIPIPIPIRNQEPVIKSGEGDFPNEDPTPLQFSCKTCGYNGIIPASCDVPNCPIWGDPMNADPMRKFNS